MQEFLKKHVGHQMELELLDMPPVSGEVLQTGEDAVVVMTKQGEVAIRPERIMMARLIERVAEPYAAPLQMEMKKEPQASNLVVSQLNRVRDSGQRIL